jgi:hypothetical protein
VEGEEVKRHCQERYERVTERKERSKYLKDHCAKMEGVHLVVAE